MPIQKKSTGLNIALGVVLIFFAFQMIFSKFFQFMVMRNGTDVILLLRNLWKTIHRFIKSTSIDIMTSTALRSLAYVLLAFCAFRGKRDAFPFVAIVLMMFSFPLFFYSRLCYQMWSPLLILLPSLLTLFADMLLATGALLIMLKKNATILRKLWFLPAVSALLAAMVNAILNNIPGIYNGVIQLYFFTGSIGTFLGVSVYVLIGLWLTRDPVLNRQVVDPYALQKYYQLNYYYDLYMRGAITAAEYEAKRRQIEGF